MKQLQSLIAFFKPSWVVTVVGITLGVALLAGTIGVVQYTSTELKPQIEAAQQDDTTLSATTNLYDRFSSRLAANNILNTAPLFLTWAGVGLVIYFLAIAIVKMLGEAEALREELGYVNTSRQTLLHDAMRRLVFRVLTIIGWFLFVQLTISIIVPYAISLSSIIITGITLLGVVCAVGAVAVIYATTYIHAVFLRLLLFKPRLFG